MESQKTGIYPLVHNFPEAVYEAGDRTPVGISPRSIWPGADVETRARPVLTRLELPTSSSRSSHANDEKDIPETRILGFRPVTFWLSLALLLLVIAAAIGAGVGSALYSDPKHKDTASVAGQTSKPTTNTTTATSTSPPAATSSTPARGIARSFCTDGTIYTAASGEKFKEFCGINWAQYNPGTKGGMVFDLVLSRRGSYAACIDSCATYNQQKGSQECGAIIFLPNLTYAVPNYGGNCWLKNQAASYNTLQPGTLYAQSYAGAMLQPKD